MARIAIIGAGLSGLVVARRLAGQHNVVVYEKSRGLGGRMATRYAGDFEFDHGAQFFTARTTRFREFLTPLAEAGAIAPWNARFVELSRNECTRARAWDADYPHYVGTPRMNSVGEYLAEGIDVRRQTRISQLTPEAGGWQLNGAPGEPIAEADWVIMTAPAAQTAILTPMESTVHRHARATQMSGCCALMLGLTALPEIDFDSALVREADISWISVNSSKPGRGDAPTLLVHSTNAWAEANQELSSEEVSSHMLSELAAVISLDDGSIKHQGLQRWRYANLPKQNGPSYILDAERSIAACGDWFIRGRVEGAFKSADSLCRKLEHLL